ncbi:MAG: DUF4412 domain-containing protein [Verrucomicrobiae bacterium]|nr:DUF4412 domain-containing protein [Verrucomicrobiae bacterium]
MKNTWPILIAVVFALVARADLTLVQEIEDHTGDANGAKEQVTLYVSGPRLRLDKGQTMSSIILNDRKVTYSILHETRQYVQMSHELFKGLGQSLGMAANAAAQANALLRVEPTDQRETIGGRPCRLVRVRDASGALTELWVTRDAAELDALLSEFKSLMDFGLPAVSGALDQHPELKGVPMRVTEYEGVNVVRRSTIKSFDRTKITPGLFEIPAGYEEIKVPALPSPGAPRNADAP